MPGADDLLADARRRHRRLVLSGSALFVSHQVGELLVPVIAGLTVDRAVTTGDGASLARWVALLLVVFAVLSTSWRWADRTISRAMEELGHEVRVDLADRALAHEGMVDRPSTGHVVSVAASDAQAVMGEPEAAFLWAGGLAGIVATAGVVLWVSVPLGLIVLLGLPPVLVLVQLLTKPIERRHAAQQEEAGKAATLATDLLRGLRPLKGLRAEPAAVDRYRTASRRSLRAGVRASNLNAANQGLVSAVIAAFVAVIALLGGRWAAEGDISIGELIAAVGATQFLVGPLHRVAYAAQLRATARASAARVAAVLDEAPAVTGGSDPVGTAASLALRGVHHAGLRGLDLDVAAGEMVAVACTDPSAADDLVELLSRIVDPEAGAVEVGGTDARRLPLPELRRTVLVSRHDAVLFRGTVREVVGADASALAAAGATDVVDALDGGLDAELGDRGLTLSGGQRQRLVLARSLTTDPPLLVLQEPTTAVDAVTEVRIAAGLRERRAGRATLVVTTSPALLAVADRVVLVDDGRVVATGTHADLDASSVAYQELVAR